MKIIVIMKNLVLFLLTFVAIGNCYSIKSVYQSKTKSKSLSSLSSTSSNAISDKVDFKVKVAETVLNTVFSIKPLFNIAKTKAREKMIKQGADIGVNWNDNKSILEKDFDKLLKNYDNLYKNLDYPDYYLKPFHAYEEGNLSWLAAMEVESAALTVHAPIFVPKGELSINGDFELRDNFHKNMKKNFYDRGFQPKKILDIGCSTGLSTLKLHESFPSCEIIAVDLSPFFLSVAKYQLETNQRLSTARNSITYMHASGEYSTLGKNDCDLVTMCLVSHELPKKASRDIFQHAFDILTSGGVLTFMDINPKSEFFIKFAANAFAFSAFKSTEPWIGDYVSMDLESTLKDVGFRDVYVLPNSPRHRTVIAYK